MQNIDVTVREVGLRDGLQIHPTFMPTDRKIAWIEAEAAAGVREALPDIPMQGALARAGLPRNYLCAEERRAT